MIDNKDYDIIRIEEDSKIDGGMDIEIKKLVELINKVDGIETTESCFGHNKTPCHIYARAKDIYTLKRFMNKFFHFDPLWKIELVNMPEAEDSDEVIFLINSNHFEYPIVNLMVDNLTYRFENRLKEKSQ